MKTFMRRLANFLVRDSNITLDNNTKNARIETFINDAFTIEMNLANVRTYNPNNSEIDYRVLFFSIKMF